MVTAYEVVEVTVLLAGQLVTVAAVSFISIVNLTQFGNQSSRFMYLKLEGGFEQAPSACLLSPASLVCPDSDARI